MTNNNTPMNNQAVMNQAVSHLVANYSPKGNKAGWLMMASILVEAWDLYSIAFVLIYIKEQFQPDPLLLGLAAAGTQAGALIGAMFGGWLADKVGRRFMFLMTMILFIILALAQAFVPNLMWLVVIRILLGIPLGADISNSYSYIMETMSKEKREIMGNRWQFMFAVGQVMTIAVVIAFIISGLNHELIWRITLGLGALPAFVIFVLRHDLPETAIWLIRNGRFREAKVAAQQMYGDSLAMLPDENVVVTRASPLAFLRDLRQDPVRRKATFFGWIACFCQSVEFSTFAFYIPVIFAIVGVSTQTGNYFVLIGLYSIAAISGWVGPQLLPRLGHKGISGYGFGIVFVSLLVAAWALYSGHTIVLAFAAATMLWGHYWDASNCMTIPAMVAKPEYRGTASGFAYMFVKLPAFLSIFLFPSLFAAIGQAASTLLVAIFPLIGMLAAIFLLPEVFGYDSD